MSASMRSILLEITANKYDVAQVLRRTVRNVFYVDATWGKSNIPGGLVASGVPANCGRSRLFGKSRRGLKSLLFFVKFERDGGLFFASLVKFPMKIANRKLV